MNEVEGAEPDQLEDRPLHPHEYLGLFWMMVHTTAALELEKGYRLEFEACYWQSEGAVLRRKLRQGVPLDLDEELDLRILNDKDPMTNLEKLDELQTQLGYTGGVHPVAMLGLMGEVGEVAEAATFVTPKNPVVTERSFIDMKNGIQVLVNVARELDRIKKTLRRKSEIHIAVRPDEAEFDDELADVLYYVNAIALGRGITLDQLAELSLAKVARKRADGMPAELSGKEVQ